MEHTPPKFVLLGKYLINAEQILHVQADNDGKSGVGISIEFIRKGTLFIPDVTIDGALSLLNGDAF